MAQSFRKCPACGNLLDAGARNCWNCDLQGQPLPKRGASAPPPPYGQPTAPAFVQPVIVRLCRRCGEGMAPRSVCGRCGWRPTDGYGIASAVLLLLTPFSLGLCGLLNVIGMGLGITSVARLRNQPHLAGWGWALTGLIGNTLVLLFLQQAVVSLLQSLRR